MLSTRKTALALGLAVPALAFAGTSQDAAMTALASKAGCLTCHSIKTPTTAPETPPVGPAWQEVAKRYHGQKDAVAQLTHTVQDGSNPYQRHWKDKSSGLAMPPNAVAISAQDTQKLVSWILTLDQ